MQPAPVPPATVGTQPQTAAEVNNLVGAHLRAFIASKTTIHQDQDYFGGTDLTAAPYYFSDDQQTLIKSAIAELDAVLVTVDMTFINRIVGMF